MRCWKKKARKDDQVLPIQHPTVGGQKREFIDSHYIKRSNTKTFEMHLKSFTRISKF